jgi:hypothetical protein
MDTEVLLNHFKATAHDDWVVLHWAKAVDDVVRVAVVRSESDFAGRAEDVVEDAAGQLLIYEGADDRCQDQGVIGGVDYYYTAFARLESGSWQRQHTYHIKPHVGHVYHRTELFDRDSPAYLQAMDRMRAGFWLNRISAR